MNEAKLSTAGIVVGFRAAAIGALVFAICTTAFGQGASNRKRPSSSKKESSSSQKQPRTADWPPPAQIEPIAGAVSAILTRSAKSTEAAFRKDLVASSDAAKKALQTQLNTCYGNGTIVLPVPLLVLFYEPLFPGADPCQQNRKSRNVVPASTDGLVLIFDLPPVDDKTHFHTKHLRCCYPVWITPAIPCAAPSPSPTP
jgi:hypothetical protein